MTDRYSSLRDTFFEECDALLGKALSLQAMPVRPGTAPDFKELHRCVHGVAGAAASMDMPRLASLARALETMLAPLRGAGDWPDARSRALCGEVLQALVGLVRQLGAGLEPDWSGAVELEKGMAALEAGSGADDAEMAGEPAPCARLIAFRVSRSLVGAEIVVEHVLEELASTGRVERLSDVGCSEDGAEPEWRLRYAGAASDVWIRELFGGVAEPGSLSLAVVGEVGVTRAAGREAADSGIREATITDAHGPRGHAEAEARGMRSATGAAEGEGEWFVGFRVATQDYLCAADEVLDVRPYRGEFVLPGLPAGVRGLIGVGDAAVPLLDGRSVLLGRESSVVPEAAQMLVLQAPGGMVALLADDAGRRLCRDPRQLRRPMALRGVFAACPVVGLHFGADGVRLVLDVRRLCAHLDPSPLPAHMAGDHPPEASAGELAENRLDGAKRPTRSATIGPAGPPVPPAPRRGRAVSAGRRMLEEEWGRPDP